MGLFLVPVSTGADPLFAKERVNHTLNSQEKLALLNEIGRMVLASQDLDRLFTDASALMRTRLGLKRVMVGTFDRLTQSVALRATAGTGSDPVAQQKPLTVMEGIIAEACRMGRTVVVNDVSADPRYVQGIPDARSELCVPLLVSGEPAGFLNVGSDRIEAFVPADVELLEAAGSFLGEAIRNARLRRELEDSRNYLEALVENAGDAIITFSLEGRIRTWNRAAQDLLGRPPESAVGLDLKDLIQGPPAPLQDAFGRVLRGEVIGGLRIPYPRGGSHEPRTLEISMAPILDGDRAVSGISCILRDASPEIRVQEELRESLKATQLLNEVSVELTSILDLDQLLEAIARTIRRFIEHDFFAILLVDEATQEFVWKMSFGFGADSLRELAHFSIHEGIVGRVARTRKPVVADDVKLEADYRPIRTDQGIEPCSELALPLVHKDRIVGVLMLGSTQRGYFRPHHLNLLTPLAAQIAVSIENASLYEQKSRDATAQQVMNEVGKEMTAILELEDLLNRVAALLRRVIQYEILGIFIYRPELQLMELKVAIGYAQETVERWRNLPLGTGLLGYAAQERKTMVATDLPNNPRAISAKTVDGRWTMSEVAIPLVSRDRLLGGMVVESCDPDYFRSDRVQILETFASQIAVSIDNAQLFQQLLAKEQKLEMDFALARDLQASMLPVTTPELPGIEVATLYKPAESLGGDYYDFIWLGEDQLGFAIGDVSGKGVAAAMTMAAARSALRFAARLHSSPSQVLYDVNRRLYRDVKKRTYVSLFYGVLDVKSRFCRWSNGGHFPPLLMRADGSKEEWTRGGMLVALFDKSRYSSARTQLLPGDLVCFYTDGVIEARNPAEEEFGKERLEEVLARKSRQPAKEVLRTLMSEIKKFTRGAEQHDDITAFILKMKEEA